MNFRNEAPAPAVVTESADQCCLRRATWIWAMDDIILNTADGRPIPTDAVDQLPPWRAVMCVRLAARAGGTMQHGDLEKLEAAARAAGGHAEPGWWRAALGLEPAAPRGAPVGPSVGEYVPPAGWTVVQRPTNAGTF